MNSIKVGDILEVYNDSYVVEVIHNDHALIYDDNMIGKVKLEDINYYDDVAWSGESGYWCNDYDIDWKYNIATQAVLDTHATSVKDVYKYDNIESLKKLLNIFHEHGILGFKTQEDLISSLSKECGLIFEWCEWDSVYDCGYSHIKVIDGAKF